jgi:hypothetical protein
MPPTKGAAERYALIRIYGHGERVPFAALPDVIVHVDEMLPPLE